MASLKQKTSSIRSKSRQTAETQISGTPVGEVLRMAREERGLTLDMVADELMIRRFYLESLEAGAFRDLPERVYAIGFVKNYANYIGLEVQPIIDQFKREAYGTRNLNNYRIDLAMPEPVLHSIVPGRSAIISAVAVLLILIAGIVFFTRGSGHEKSAPSVPSPMVDAAPVVDAPVAAASTPASTSAPAPETVTTTTEAPEFTSAAPATAPPAAAPVVAHLKNRQAIEALQSAWVEIRDAGGKTLYTGILKATQLLPLPDNARVTLTTGNAGGLRLVIDGQPQAAFGQINEVKRNIVIDAPVAAGAAVPSER